MQEVQSKKYKLFSLLPIFSWKKKGNKTKWKILGLPVFKRQIKSDGCKIKFYIFGLLILKISKK